MWSGRLNERHRCDFSSRALYTPRARARLLERFNSSRLAFSFSFSNAPHVQRYTLYNYDRSDRLSWRMSFGGSCTNQAREFIGARQHAEMNGEFRF